MGIASPTAPPGLLSKHGGVSRLLVTPGQRDWLDVNAVEIFMHRLASTFDGYRIVQFSDLHLDGKMMTPKRLAEAVAHINAQQPDLVAFTGDFITKSIAFREDDLIAALRGLAARDGKVAVMGNHDHSAAAGVIERVIAESGMINLNNAVHTIQRDGDCLHIAGVDSLVTHYARLDQVLQRLPDRGAAILLAHEPQFIDVSASTGRFALQLSGHTHGGQINIPLLTRRLVSSCSHRRLSGGQYIGGMLLYINRGLGTVALPFRFNCPPELTVFTLRAYSEMETNAS